MAFKFVIFAAVVAVARAGLIASPAVSYAAAPALVAAPVAKVAYAAAPIAKVAYAAQPEEYDANPQYSFSYGISDALTGDSKSQQESRSGDVVQGSYSVVDPDGTKRTVDYTADPHNGFNAVVRREPLAAKTIVAAAPVATKVIAQPAVAYAAPVAKTISYAAPVATKTYVAQPALSYAAPLTKTYVSQPALSYAAPVAKTISYSAPLATKTYVSQPAISYAAPLATKTYVSQPALSYAAPAYAYHSSGAVNNIFSNPDAKMAFKFVAFAALIAVARAGLIASPAVSYAAAPAVVAAAPVAKVAYAAAPAVVAAPVAKVAYAAQPEEYDANPHYSFSYGISDALTGDSKSQQESRSGDVVQGSYSVVDPDGTKRTVEYTADPHNGFNAVVHREPLAAKTIVAAAPVATKTIVAQPAVAYAAPVAKTISYAAPLATKTVVASPAISYAAPVAKLATPVAYTAALHH
ncbi:cuticle protein-like [Anopheles arabiensis]|uniref:cuticle protein-like n=1 Tax=Anopheles arabiensis TaxID=7173 RepID=UPI001AAD6F65|nr:cuticle protein-like [Anopheles arabiensis]